LFYELIGAHIVNGYRFFPEKIYFEEKLLRGQCIGYVRAAASIRIQKSLAYDFPRFVS